MANTLFLRLEGPMQAWGERARWSVRDSAPEPTKSGVVGLLACAMGWKDDEQLRNLSRQVRIGVRCDKPGTPMVDYHTIVGGVLAANGEIKINDKTHLPETVQTWRTYLHDASFLVAVQATSDLIERLAQAVQDPFWPCYLGRKSCPPTRSLFEGTGNFDGLRNALKDWPLHPSQEGSQKVRIVLECAPHEGARRRDEVDCSSRRTFLPRYVREELLTIDGHLEEV